MGTANFQQTSLGLTRSLTEVFILLRNNVQQSRHVFADVVSGAKSEDRLTLIPLDGDLESGGGGASNSRTPPEWVNIVDEIQYEMSRIRTRITDLREVQRKHVSQPRFDDGLSQEERQIELGTQEITKMLAHCQRLLQLIGQGGGDRQGKLKSNVFVALVQSLQQLTLDFRTCQANYLKQLRSREENYQQYFDDTAHDTGGDFDFNQITAPSHGKELSMAQLQLLEESMNMSKEREDEIRQISRSIVEVNQLFKDLAQLVVDQGSVVDRIDYNIEQSHIKVKAALGSVKKAEQYQKKNRKMTFIVILAGVIILLVLILIIVKS